MLEVQRSNDTTGPAAAGPPGYDAPSGSDSPTTINT